MEGVLDEDFVLVLCFLFFFPHSEYCSEEIISFLLVKFELLLQYLQIPLHTPWHLVTHSKNNYSFVTVLQNFYRSRKERNENPFQGPPASNTNKGKILIGAVYLEKKRKRKKEGKKYQKTETPTSEVKLRPFHLYSTWPSDMPRRSSSLLGTSDMPRKGNQGWTCSLWMYYPKDIPLGWYFCFRNFSLNAVKSFMLPETHV